MKSGLVLVVCLAAILTLPAPAAAQGPNPNEPYIVSIGYGGTGCPAGSVGQSISNDRT